MIEIYYYIEFPIYQRSLGFSLASVWQSPAPIVSSTRRLGKEKFSFSLLPQEFFAAAFAACM